LNTCENCKWWADHRTDFHDDFNYCENEKVNEQVTLSEDAWGILVTHKDFGCIHWEENER